MEHAAPIFEWRKRAGPVTLTYHAVSKRYLLAGAARNESCGVGAAGWKACTSDVYLAEATAITGPYRLIAYMKDFGPGGYFPVIPSKFLKADGSGALMFSAFDRKAGANPPISAYSLSVLEMQLLPPTPGNEGSNERE